MKTKTKYESKLESTLQRLKDELRSPASYEIEKEHNKTFFLTPLDITRQHDLRRGVLLSPIRISHIEFRCDGFRTLRCVGYSLDNITPASLERIITEIDFVISDFNNPEYAEIESVEEQPKKLTKKELRALELESAKQRVTRLEEINNIKK